MSQLNRLQDSIDYIEKNLKEVLTLEKIADQAGYSLFHFHRIFQALTGKTLKEYIRRRRLSQAAKDLLHSRESILDIALSYQFETPESFLRAFRTYFGVNPSVYRKKNIETFFSSPLNLWDYKAIKQRVLEPKFVRKGKLLLVGITTVIPFEDDTADKPIKLWEKFFSEVQPMLPETVEGRNFGYSRETKEGESLYMAGQSTGPLSTIREDLVFLEVPEREYISFRIRDNPSKIPELWNAVYGDITINSQFELAFSEELEIFSGGVDLSLVQVELCIPVIR